MKIKNIRVIDPVNRTDTVRDICILNGIIVSEEEYRKQLQEIYTQQENSEKLISEMADRYSRMDFDEVDEFNRHISSLILEGRLTEADSLLNTKGDINSRAATLRHHQEANAQAELEIKKKQKKLEKSKAMTQKELEDLSQDCYSKFEIFRIQHQNDSALHYIKIRTELDTTNIKRQLEICSFLTNYMSSYEEALSYGYKAKKLATEKVVNDSSSYVLSLLAIASVYYKTHDYNKSLEIYGKAIELLEESNISVDLLCTAYNNVGAIYKVQAKYSKALDYFLKSKDKIIAIYGEEHPHLVASFNNIGEISLLLKSDYDTALNYYEKALDIIRDLNEKDNSDLARTFLNIGKVYEKKKDYSVAMDYYQNALIIQTNIYGDFHPAVAICYESIGMLYNLEKEYNNSIDNMRKGLTIRHKIHGEIDPEVAMSYTMIATSYQNLHNLDSALIYHNKALDIQKSIYGEKHPYTAFSYLTLASCYGENREYQTALEYADIALYVFKETLGNEHPYVATTLKFSGDMKKKQGLFTDAISMYKEAESVFVKALGVDNPKTQKVRQCIDEISNK